MTVASAISPLVTALTTWPSTVCAESPAEASVNTASAAGAARSILSMIRLDSPPDSITIIGSPFLYEGVHRYDRRRSHAPRGAAGTYPVPVVPEHERQDRYRLP